MKEYNYSISISFRNAKRNDQIVSIGDSQILRSIRNITKRDINKEYLELLFKRRNEFGTLPNSKENACVIRELDNKIYDYLFVPEYLSVSIDSSAHYKHIKNKGVTINGIKYKRFSCSSSQQRVETVILVSEIVYDELHRRISNDRKRIPINPSKENAYFGLASSATRLVRKPRVCIIDDCLVNRKTYVNWVTEVIGENLDDIIEQKFADIEFNLFDGMGIITHDFAIKWSEDLELDYIPDQFCIRHSYIKGMLCQFDIIDFCKLKNNNKFLVSDIYGKEHDLKNIDVILTKSQFKMWNCYDNYDSYNALCDKNGLFWGISQFSARQCKDILTMNYQSIQTLNLNESDIKELCNQTIEIFSDITNERPASSILSLIGNNITIDNFKTFLQKDGIDWLKCLVINKELIHDKYIQDKVYENISDRLKNTYIGEIYVDGNYQVMISDPYALAEHICGLEVNGLLRNKEHYSNYWITKNVNKVDAMRSPLTYKSEHNILNLITNDEIEYWYKYIGSGIVYNIHGNDTVLHADSDFDFDIIATTNDCTVIKTVHHNTLPVAYAKKTAPKILCTYEDLCNADINGFGSKIGQITNRSTSMFAMQALYEINSPEWIEIENRLILTRVRQGNEIDRAKTGYATEFPKHWTTYSKTMENDNEELTSKKELWNKILINKKPYFFRYRYDSDRKEYKKYFDGRNKYCLVTFGKSLNEILESRTTNYEETKFIESFYKFSPFLHNKCVMNDLCLYMASFNFNLKKKIRTEYDIDVWKKYTTDQDIDDLKCEKMKKIVLEYFESIQEISTCNRLYGKSNQYSGTVSQENIELKEKLTKICSNTEELVNHLVYTMYVKLPNKNKNMLWILYGKYIYENVKNKASVVEIPFLSQDDYDFKFMGKTYKMLEVLM